MGRVGLPAALAQLALVEVAPGEARGGDLGEVERRRLVDDPLGDRLAEGPAELGDPSLRQAMYNWEDFFIARIHGRADVPETMVLDSSDYLRTENDPYYIEFLTHVLTRFKCLFLGYSFVDPAINRVLQVVEQRVGPTFSAMHLAVLPGSADHLAARLAKFNVATIFYDSGGGHDVLWKVIRDVLTLSRQRGSSPQHYYPPVLEPARRLLASCYARMRLGASLQPVKRIVIEGIVLGLLAEMQSASQDKLIERLRNIIALTTSEAEAVILDGTDGLLERGVIGRTGDDFIIVTAPENRLEDERSVLASGVCARLRVREGYTAAADDIVLIKVILEDTVLLRGWDLGASLAGANLTPDFDVSPILRAAISYRAAHLSDPSRERLARAGLDLLQRPEPEEARILVRLGRLAFGVEIALERGRSTLSHTMTLPEIVYLDSNVVLPAMCEGHPYRSAYLEAIRKLRDAASRAGGDIKVRILDVFLNEIMSHRSIAIRSVREQLLENVATLDKYVSYMGAENVNVFLTSYLSLAHSGDKLSFAKYLSRIAPYQTERELSDFLTRFGIETSKTLPRGIDEQSAFMKIVNELALGYQREAAGLYDRKPDILIQHEAAQLARLKVDLDRSRRSVFVTATAACDDSQAVRFWGIPEALCCRTSV